MLRKEGCARPIVTKIYSGESFWDDVEMEV